MSIDSIVARQGGVISRQQATAAGLTPDGVDDRLRRRRWHPMCPQVYLVTGRPADAETRVRAALLWAGEGAVLTGAAAAWWHGSLRQPPSTITVAVPGPPRARPGIVVRRRGIGPADLTECRGIHLAARPLAVLEGAVELGAAGLALLDRVLLDRAPLDGTSRSRLLLADLCAALRRNPSTGAERQLAAAAYRSAAASGRLLVRLLQEAGLPGRRGTAWSDDGCDHPVLVAAMFPAARVMVEVSGWECSSHPQRRFRPGWTVLRFSWADLETRPQEVLAEITSATGARAPTNVSRG